MALRWYAALEQGPPGKFYTMALEQEPFSQSIKMRPM